VAGPRRQIEIRNPDRSGRDGVTELYHRAFVEYGVRALWNIKRFDEPTLEQALAITRQLKTEGDLSARQLTEEIERAVHAHL
jgi:hypothetical protein